MKVTAIRNYEPCRTVSKMSRGRNTRASVLQTEPKTDSVAFKSKETAAGIGIGALLGLGAITILSGGTAAPFACAAYAAATGTAGGMFGHAISETNKERENQKS